jgi:hypothetical protein
MIYPSNTSFLSFISRKPFVFNAFVRPAGFEPATVSLKVADSGSLGKIWLYEKDYFEKWKISRVVF